MREREYDIKQEIFRLISPAAGRARMRNRWEYVCWLHDKGLDFAHIGRLIDRHETTAKRLWKRGTKERMVPAVGVAPTLDGSKPSRATVTPRRKMVPPAGDDPATLRLKAGCSAC